MQHIIKQFILWVKLFILLLLPKKTELFIQNTKEDNMHLEEGEFTVVGNDDLEKVLAKEPRLVFLEFVDDQVLVPCDPHHHHHSHHRHDHLDWYVKHYHKHFKHGNNYVLRVSWEVQSVRTVKYIIEY